MVRTKCRPLSAFAAGSRAGDRGRAPADTGRKYGDFGRNHPLGRVIRSLPLGIEGVIDSPLPQALPAPSMLAPVTARLARCWPLLSWWSCTFADAAADLLQGRLLAGQVGAVRMSQASTTRDDHEHGGNPLAPCRFHPIGYSQIQGACLANGLGCYHLARGRRFRFRSAT